MFYFSVKFCKIIKFIRRTFIEDLSLNFFLSCSLLLHLLIVTFNNFKKFPYNMTSHYIFNDLSITLFNLNKKFGLNT